MDQVLGRVPRVSNEKVLVGFDTADDAGVYKLSAECALIQTVDFFTPIVDDPYTYGAIAAANSLSDVYAMGGRPICALSIVAFPGDGDTEILAEILTGGAEKLREADCVLVGGHSINDAEMKFGYAITGAVHPSKVLRNAGARPGDLLVLTKPVGTGVISTALKRGIAAAAHVEASIRNMLELNRAAGEAMGGVVVHGCTDVTGFGLVGHAREVALASGVTLEIDSRQVPLLDGALEYAEAGALPGGLKNNRSFAACDVEFAGELSEPLVNLLHDPQTSGGLLMSLPEESAAVIEQAIPAARRIGRVIPRRDRPVRLL